MGLTDWFRNVFNRGGNSTSMFSVGNREVMTPIDNTNAITEGFNKTAAVYSIVMRDAEKFGVIPRYVYSAKNKEEKSYHKTYQKKSFDAEKVDNKLAELLNRPNEYESQDAFFTKLRAYYKASGEAFIWLNRGDIAELDTAAAMKKQVLEMYVLPSQYVDVVPDLGNMFGVSDYILNCGKKLRLGKANVIHWKMPTLDFDSTSGDHLRGMTPLRPGALTLQQYKDSTTASVRMYQNDGAKGITFNEQLGSMSPSQEAALRGVIDKKINNNDVKGAVAYLQGKWGYVDIGKSNTDLGLLEGKNLTWKEMCFLFNVPYYFFNPEIAYADANRSMVDWISNSIVPGCKQLDGEMNRYLPEAFGLKGQVFIGSDVSELPEVQEITFQNAEKMAKLWMITPNEVRETLGFESIPGELDEIWVTSGLTPLSQFNDGMDAAAQMLAEQGLNDTNV
jgi:HK97 family phage portal protein